MNQTPDERNVDLKSRLFRLNTLIGFVLAGIIIYIFTTRFNLGQTAKIIGSANILLFLAAIIVFYGFLPLRVHRWQRLLAESNIRLPVIELTRIYFID
jgi:uncharacterized membrane protein YbhN (UPF0104 family)